MALPWRLVQGGVGRAAHAMSADESRHSVKTK